MKNMQQLIMKYTPITIFMKNLRQPIMQNNYTPKTFVSIYMTIFMKKIRKNTPTTFIGSIYGDIFI